MTNISYAKCSDLMEQHARELGFETHRVDSITFQVGALTFQKTNLLDREMIRNCKRKELTKSFVSEAGLRVPKTYSPECVEYPCVVKPGASWGGKGVTIVHDPGSLSAAMEYAGEGAFIEEYIEGIVYRVLVARGTVISVLEQISPNVVGDGESSIRQLVKNKNRDRGKTLADAELSVESWVDVERVPENGEFVKVNSFSTRALGADVTDIVDTADAKLKEFAVAAAAAIPRVVFAGLDIIYDGKNPTFIEANSTPMLTAHYHPQDGSDPVLVHKFIVESYLRMNQNDN